MGKIKIFAPSYLIYFRGLRLYSQYSPAIVLTIDREIMFLLEFLVYYVYYVFMSCLSHTAHRASSQLPKFYDGQTSVERRRVRDRIGHDA